MRLNRAKPSSARETDGGRERRAVEPVAEFELKGIRRPLAAYNVIAALS
jgi:hypothetical protein